VTCHNISISYFLLTVLTYFNVVIHFEQQTVKLNGIPLRSDILVL